MVQLLLLLWRSHLGSGQESIILVIMGRRGLTGLMALLPALFWLLFNQAVTMHLLAWSALASFCAVSPKARQLLGREATSCPPSGLLMACSLSSFSIIHFTMALSCLGDPGSLAFPEVTWK